MLNSTDKYLMSNKIKIIEMNLIELKKFQLNLDVLEQLILFCQSYEFLSLNDIQQSEIIINKIYFIIKNNKDLPIEFKKQFLNLLKELQNICTSLTVNTIIDLI